jgi:hypothetical protein
MHGLAFLVGRTTPRFAMGELDGPKEYKVSLKLYTVLWYLSRTADRFYFIFCFSFIEIKAYMDSLSWWCGAFGANRRRPRSLKYEK